MRRSGAPPGGSTLMTSAPKSASKRAQYSPTMPPTSITRIPASGPGALACVVIALSLRGNGARSRLHRLFERLEQVRLQRHTPGPEGAVLVAGAQLLPCQPNEIAQHGRVVGAHEGRPARHGSRRLR